MARKTVPTSLDHPPPSPTARGCGERESRVMRKDGEPLQRTEENKKQNTTHAPAFQKGSCAERLPALHLKLTRRLLAACRTDLSGRLVRVLLERHSVHTSPSWCEQSEFEWVEELSPREMCEQATKSAAY